MNKVGIYYAFWTQQWDADFHPFVDKVSDLGFDILEINAGTIAAMSRAERASLMHHATERGIDLTYCIGLPAGYDISSEEEGTRRRGVEFLKRMASGIGEMGGGRLGGIIYASWPALLPEGATDKQPYWERSVASMREAIRTAEDNNVVFNMEVVNRFEQFLLNTAQEGVAYVKEVGSPNAKVLLDTYHMNIEEDSIKAAIETAGEYLGHVHIGENNRKPPGYGHFPWAELASALAHTGYKGAIVMEPFVVPGGQVGRDIRVWRDLRPGLDDLDTEAGKALRFVRDILRATQPVS
jgi:D-psicose/D-tagatose/L-ribulose 3-epimerase